MGEHSDENTTIGELKREVKKFSGEREWLKYHNPKDLAISISIEASELLEHFQWLTDEEIERCLSNPRDFNEMKSELADVVNYSLALSNRLGIDISTCLLDKIKDNERKYPVSKVKGNYKKYSEIK
jgi:dCTP diphosphatase